MDFLKDERAMVRIIDYALLLGVIALLGIGILPKLADRLGLFEPVPYRDVQIQSVEAEGDTLHIKGTFVKTRANCVFEKAVVMGLGLGGVTPLVWTEFRGPNMSAQRTPGLQPLDWTINLDGQLFDNIEIRTRHDCAGNRVDRTLAIVEVPK